MKQKVKITWKAVVSAVLIVSVLIMMFWLAGTSLFKFLVGENGISITAETGIIRKSKLNEENRINELTN